jgi:hypothetical protein
MERTEFQPIFFCLKNNLQSMHEVIETVLQKYNQEIRYYSEIIVFLSTINLIASGKRV